MTTTRQFVLATATAALAGLSCSQMASLEGQQSAGRAVAVDNGTQLPSGHPAVVTADPGAAERRVGRAPRRLNVDQLRASLLAATGYTWIGAREVLDEESPTGRRRDPNTDMLEALAPTLGRADFVTTTSHAIDPSVTFSKLASDAARSACRLSVQDDARQADAAQRRIVRHAAVTDTLAANRDAIRNNLSYLALRFWGRTIGPGSPELDGLTRLFERASTAPAEPAAMGRPARAAGTPADGWRVVCIAMATDPQFLTY